MSKKQKMISVDEDLFKDFMDSVNPSTFSSWVNNQMTLAIEEEDKNSSLVQEIKDSTELLWLYINKDRFKDLLHFLGVYNCFINATGSIMNKRQVQQFLKRIDNSEEDFTEVEMLFLKSASVCPVCSTEFSTDNPKKLYNKSLGFYVCNNCLLYRVKDIDPCLAEFKKKIQGSDE